MHSLRVVRGLAGALLLFLLAVCAVSARGDEPGFLERTGEALQNAFSTAQPSAPADVSSIDAPRTIAVLPAVGQGTAEQRDDIRTAIHNSLSSKNFDLKRPQETDLALTPPASIRSRWCWKTRNDWSRCCNSTAWCTSTC
jgi:uncharacterized lipoprotein